jgi:hypothetical protein
VTALALSPATPPSPLELAPRFCWEVHQRQWRWIPEPYVLNGLVPASTEQTLKQVHPRDLHSWVDAMHAGMQQRQLVLHQHRLVDGQGQTRPVLLVALPFHGPDGLTIRVDGILLPLDDEDGLLPSPDDAPELVLLAMNTLGLSQVAARALLRCCGPARLGGARQRLQVVSDDGSSTADGGDLRADVAAALFPRDSLVPAAG